MKIKTSKLIGSALDWAVAKCEGKTPRIHSHKWGRGVSLYGHYGATIPLEYSKDWSQGGPIIEREFIELASFSGGGRH